MDRHDRWKVGHHRASDPLAHGTCRHVSRQRLTRNAEIVKDQGSFWRGRSRTIQEVCREIEPDEEHSAADRWMEWRHRRRQIRALKSRNDDRRAALRRRSQFAQKPTDSFFGFHRIDKLDHALVDVAASRTFEGSNIKAGGVGGDACQHRSCFAPWTWWPMKRDHDASPWIRRERYRTLSHRWRAEAGGGDGNQY